MKNKFKEKSGFATSGVLYTLLLLFVALLFGVLQNLQNKKTILDQLKIETINALSCDCAKMEQDILKNTQDIQTLKNINIRYNEETDKIQIYYQEQWFDILDAGVKRTYLFNQGNINYDLTGGFIQSGDDLSSTIGKVISLPNKNTPRVLSKSPIDITNYKTLHVNVEGSGWYGFASNSNPTEAQIVYTSTNNSTLDISELSGKYYFVCQYGQIISQIWLSK